MSVDLICEIEKYLASAEKFDEAEELLLATWLLGKEDPSISIKYDYCQSRTAVRLTFDKERHFVNGIYWDYDVDNDELGELSVKMLGHEFTHQAVWERYADSWYEYWWLGPNDEVCDALNDVLNMCVHSGGCDEWVYCEEPFVDKYIIASALRNTRRHGYCHFYLLADRGNQVYLASDIKRDIDECAEYWVLFDGWMSGDKQERVSLGRLRQISDEECVQLLLKQKLVISQEFDDDAIWLPKEGKLMPLQAMANETVHLPRPLSDGRYLARDLAHALKKAFKEHSYTSSAIAAGVGFDRHEVVAWCKGRGVIPLECLRMLCKHMGIEVEDLGVDLRFESSSTKVKQC